MSGLEEAAQMEDVVVFHSGSAKVGEQILTAGGRVLGVTARGATLEQALARAYKALSVVHFDGIYFRRDIGHRALKKR
jgi:phosphoribosylamine--glycine ligase